MASKGKRLFNLISQTDVGSPASHPRWGGQREGTRLCSQQGAVTPGPMAPQGHGQGVSLWFSPLMLAASLQEPRAAQSCKQQLFQSHKPPSSSASAYPPAEPGSQISRVTMWKASSEMFFLEASVDLVIIIVSHILAQLLDTSSSDGGVED